MKDAPLGVPMDRPVYSPAQPPPFRPLGGLAVGVMVLLGACAAADLFSLFAGVRIHGLLGDVLNATEEEIDAADTLYALTGLLQVAALLATAAVFIVWFHRSRKNAELFDASRMRRSSGWAIGSWFIPIGNLWLPKKVANDVWWASTPPAPDGVWQAPRFGVVTTWWAFFTVANVVGNGASRMYVRANDVDGLQFAVEVLMASDVLNIAAAAVAIVYVRKLSAMQELRNALGPAADAPPYVVPGPRHS